MQVGDREGLLRLWGKLGYMKGTEGTVSVGLLPG